MNSDEHGNLQSKRISQLPVVCRSNGNAIHTGV